MTTVPIPGDGLLHFRIIYANRVFLYIKIISLIQQAPRELKALLDGLEIILNYSQKILMKVIKIGFYSKTDNRKRSKKELKLIMLPMRILSSIMHSQMASLLGFHVMSVCISYVISVCM